MADQPRTMFHYSTAEGYAGITSSERLLPSLKAVNPKDARHGDGQYLTDIVPGTMTLGEMSYAFLKTPRGWRRFTHYIEIDVIDLIVVEGRSNVFVICNSAYLPLAGRIVGGGLVPRLTV